jgi:hypothetical protein
VSDQVSGEKLTVRSGARVRSRRRALSAFTIVLVLAASVPAFAAEVVDQAPIGGPIPPFGTDPAFQKSMAANESNTNQGPSAQASRTLYGDQSASEALRIAMQENPELIGAPAWQPMSLSPGEQVERYLGDHAARIDIEGQTSDALVESVFPLRVPADSGQLEPVDLTLVDTGSVIRPRNPLVAMQAGVRLSEPSTLPDIGIGVRPTETQGDPVGQLVEDKVFYANAYQDTDYLIRALPAGLEALLHLRSIDSPEGYSLEVDLPEGAELRKQTGGGAAVVRGGDALAQIAAPAAWDAKGDLVPVSLSVLGDKLKLSIDHRAGNWTYPLVLDPPVVEEYRYWSNPVMDYTGWETRRRQPVSNFWQDFSESDAVDYYTAWGRGLYNWGVAGPGGAGWYDANDYAQWYYDAPGSESFIYKGEFSAVSHSPGTPDLSTPIIYGATGIWSPSRNQWDAGVVAETGQPSPRAYYTYYPYETSTHCLASDCGPSAGTPNNQMILASWASCTCYVAWPQPTTYMAGAAVWLADQTAPVQGAPVHHWDATPGLPDRWIDDTNLTVVLSGLDGGLGLKHFKLDVPGLPQRVRTWPCQGDRHSPCPRNLRDSAAQGVTGDSFAYATGAIPSGVRTVTAKVEDFAGNLSLPATWELRVDHDDPTLALSGTLADHNGQTLDHGVYRLGIDAGDLHSGVQRIEIEVDGRPADSVENPCDATLDAPCPTETEAEYEFVTAAQIPGWHEIKVNTTDAVFNTTHSETIRVRTDYTAECPAAHLDRGATSNPLTVDSCPDPSPPNAFDGLCNVDGSVTYEEEWFDEGGFGGRTEVQLRADGTGACSGQLNGQSISDEPVRLTLTDQYSCRLLTVDRSELANDSGPGVLTFTNGTLSDASDDAVFALTYEVTGSTHHLLRLFTNDDGEAAGPLSLAGTRGWGGCSPLASAFHTDFQTVTELHDEA